MNSEDAAYQASQQRHHHNMVFGKKQRCIEVFQISGEDIDNILVQQ
jgi:epithelial splicing regulatory protein 1/2